MDRKSPRWPSRKRRRSFSPARQSTSPRPRPPGPSEGRRRGASASLLASGPPTPAPTAPFAPLGNLMLSYHLKLALKSLRRLRSALVRPARERLTGVVQVDKTYIGTGSADVGCEELAPTCLPVRAHLPAQQAQVTQRRNLVLPGTRARCHPRTRALQRLDRREAHARHVAHPTRAMRTPPELGSPAGRSPLATRRPMSGEWVESPI